MSGYNGGVSVFSFLPPRNARWFVHVYLHVLTKEISPLEDHPKRMNPAAAIFAHGRIYADVAGKINALSFPTKTKPREQLEKPLHIWPPHV